MGLFKDWDNYIYYIFGSEQKRKEGISFLKDYFAAHDPLAGTEEFNLYDIQSHLGGDLGRMLAELRPESRYWLSFGFPEQNYSGPFCNRSRFYEVDVVELEERDNKIGLYMFIFDKEKGEVVYDSFFVSGNDQDDFLSELEPKLMTLMRKADPETLDELANGLIIANSVDIWLDC